MSPTAHFAIDKIEDADEFFVRLQKRFDPDQEAGSTEERVRAILKDVKKRGLQAVLDYTRQFDAPTFKEESFKVPEKELTKALDALSQDHQDTIIKASKNIRRFHERQKEDSWFISQDDGTILGQMSLPVDRAGLYIPGGKGGSNPLISSALMNIIPAQVAGVKEIALISPPTEDGTVSPYILAIAKLLGIEEVYAAGSAWAIGALAYGAGPLRPVDVIAGPGNIFVATAKRLLIGTVGIDMLAGPSEILILADESADPSWVAADMLSQAEHDPLASALCISSSKKLAEEVLKELKKQLEGLPREDIARESLKNFGAVIWANNQDLAFELSNKIAPEHLELLLKDPWLELSKIRHAGAIFLGHYSSEALGDYFAGPNHVLPTMGNARFSSALGVEVFTKKSSVISASPKYAKESAEAVASMARIEGLEAHARSALVRKNNKKAN